MDRTARMICHKHNNSQTARRAVRTSAAPANRLEEGAVRVMLPVVVGSRRKDEAGFEG